MDGAEQAQSDVSPKDYLKNAASLDYNVWRIVTDLPWHVNSYLDAETSSLYYIRSAVVFTHPLFVTGGIFFPSLISCCI